MIKKITLTLIFCCIMISCGKKGDPKYKVPEKKAKIQNILLNKT
jgi:hypothetical protein